MDLTEPAQAALQSLRRGRNDLVTQARVAEDVPSASPTLDVASRAHDPSRTFKHLQQICLMHEWAFRSANKVKLAYLADAYCVLVDGNNPLGLYAVARSLLEFHAFASFVSGRLRKTAASGDAWQTRGENFFGTLARARFGTGDPELKKELASNGVSENHIKPFHVNDCVRDLTKVTELDWVEGHYATLCDHVHHNLPSTRVSVSAKGVTRELPVGHARMMFAKDTTFLRYEYGSAVQLEQAVETTVVRAFQSILGVIAAASGCPSSPFTEKECMDMTGDPLGFGKGPA